MKLLFAAIGIVVLATGSACAADGQPLWAWGFSTPAPAPGSAPRPVAAPRPATANAAPQRPAPDATLYTIPGSKNSFTRAQVGNRHDVADWFPEDHPSMPEIVSKGRASANPPIYACGLCHMPNGKGRPENANLTGLSYEYIMQQLQDFKNGLRVTSDSRKTNTALMEGFAKQMTEEEMKAAAAYFSSIPATPWTKVIEADMVPKTTARGGVFFVNEGNEAGMEPLGQRIIEMPTKTEDFEILRNPRGGFIAYAPPGSIKKGETLVNTGDGKVTPCTVCHGADLRGLGPVPRLAGLSPLYLARQLYDMQVSNRKGAWSPLMASVLGPLTEDDVLAASAYLASLTP